MISVRSSSSEETKAVAGALSEVLSGGDVVLLIGDMGAGKTTFVKGLGAAMGVQEPITSPTFVLLHTYEGKVPLHHADLYRLDQLNEVLDLGIMELIDDGGIALVEWADRGMPAFPSDALRIEFSYDEVDENARHFKFHPTGSKWSERADVLTSVLDRWTVES